MSHARIILMEKFIPSRIHFGSYIQSRGRARARNSDYIVMLPTDSSSKYLAFSGKE
jgi:hypothetical protein